MLSSLLIALVVPALSTLQDPVQAEERPRVLADFEPSIDEGARTQVLVLGTPRAA